MGDHVITYPLIASEILDRLFSGPKRSSDLTKGLGFSAKLVYQTLDEMEKEEILSIQTDRPKFKVYEITDKGSEIVIDSKVKSQSGAMREIKKSPDMDKILGEMYRIVLNQRKQPKKRTVPAFAVGALATITGAAAYSRSIEKMLDGMHSQPSKTLAPAIETGTSAT